MIRGAVRARLTWIRRAARWALPVALAAAFGFAVAPDSGPQLMAGSDKIMHWTAFAFLSALGRIGYPQSSLVWIAFGLSLFGVAIEVVQGMPIVARDSDIADWAADILGVAGGLAAVWAGGQFISEHEQTGR